MLGGQMTKLDSFVIRTFIQLGFMTTFGSMLPPLLAMFDIPAMIVWRASSAVMAVLLGWWALTFPRRRHAASPTKVPKPVLFVIAVLDFAALALTVNATIAPAERAVGVYAAAVTAILLGGGILFLFSLIFLFERPLESTQPGPKS
jgi:hypothetical protein